MVKFDFSYEELQNSVEEILKYLSGKRADEPADYFRYVACKADSPLLRRLFRESLLWMAVKMNSVWKGAEYGEEGVMVSLEGNSNECDRLLSGTEFRWLFEEALLHRSIFLWLRLTGWSEAGYWEEKSAALLEEIWQACRDAGRIKPLKTRDSGPF